MAGFKEAIIEALVHRYGESTLDASPAKVSNKIKKATLSQTPGISTFIRSKWNSFVRPDIDFKLIEKAVYTDSYLSRAINKYVDLLWKNGYNVKTTSPEVFKYIRQRMVLHTFATGEPFDQFLERLSRELITYHNVLVYIRRFDPSEIGPLGKAIGRKISPLDSEKYPAVGYELIPVTSIEVKADSKNNIEKWLQKSPNSDKEYDKNQVIHIKKGNWAGKLWGDPFVRPVVDDIKAYRQIEEDSIIIAHQMVEPKIVYKVGDTSMPITIQELDDNDIDEAAASLQYALENGAIVIPGSHSVDVLNTKNAQDISNYMTSLRSRIFGGLGLSPVHFGEAGGANRSVTDRLDVQLYDAVKSYQRTISQYITFFIFAEWLMEAGFDTDFSLEDDEDWAIMEFEEIDTDSMIQKQNHNTSLWVQDGITHDEYRKTLGKLPITAEQESRLYSDMIGRINAKYQKEVDKSKSQETSGGENQKTNAKTRAKKTSSIELSEATSSQEWEELRQEIISYITLCDFNSIDKAIDDITYIYSFYFNKIEEYETQKSSESFWAGYSEGENQAVLAGYTLNGDITSSTAFLSSSNKHIKKYIDKLKRELRTRVENSCDIAKTKKELLELVEDSFNVLQSRLTMISDTEIRAAHNYGVLCVAYINDIEKVWREGTEECDVCTSGFEQVKYTGIEDIPPFSTHPNCKCFIKIV